MSNDIIGKTATTVRGKMIDGYLSVVYHETEVVKVDKEFITLNTGGWWTLTTKARMNQASVQYHLGYKVYQKDYQWYVNFKGTDVSFGDDRILVLKR